MSGRDIIVIGASAGGVQAVLALARDLPADLPAAVFVVIHTSRNSPGFLASLVDRAGPLKAAAAVDGEAVHHGRIYIACPDHHLLLKGGVVRVTRGPKENGFRPAVDPLFRTAAASYGARVIGVVLSGNLNDGTQGLGIIKRRGGVAVVQDPDEAIFADMPASAMLGVEVDYLLPVAAMPPVLARLARDVEEGANGVSANGPRKDVAEAGDNALERGGLPGPPSGFTCPECGGALWELHEDKLVRYRCHVGHSFTAEALAVEQSEALEDALWSAVRALDENAALRQRMAGRSERWPVIAERYHRDAEEAISRANVIRTLLVQSAPTTTSAESTPKPVTEPDRRKSKAKAPGATGKPRRRRRSNGSER